MAALGSLVVSLALDYAQYTQGLDRSSQDALKFAKNAQRSFDDASKSVKDFLTGTVASATAAVGSLVALNKSFNDSLEFSKSIRALSTQIDGPIQQVKELEAASKSLAVQFGTMPIEQSKAFYEILSTGITETTQATALLTQANKLAIGGNADLQAVIGGLTSVMKSYEGKINDVQEVSDALFVSSLAGKISIEELSAGLGNVAPLANVLNVSFDELTATVAALTTGGTSASQAFTGMRAVLAAVAKPSVEATKLAKSLGLEFNSAALQSKGFTAFLDDLREKTGGSADAISILFGGIEASVPALALMGNAGKEFNDIMAQMAEKLGITEKSFKKMDGPGDRFNQLLASINAASLRVGETLVNHLAPAAEIAARAINNLFGLNTQKSPLQDQEEIVRTLAARLEKVNEFREKLGGFGEAEAKELEQQLAHAVRTLGDLRNAGTHLGDVKKGLDGVAESSKSIQPVIDRVTVSTKEAVSEADRFLHALIKETESAGKSSLELKRLEAARLGILKTAEPLIDALEAEDKALRAAQESARQYRDQLSRAMVITESVMTEEERLAQTQAELNVLHEQGFLSLDTYNRALKQAEDQFSKTGKSGKEALDDISQFAIQAQRNLQNALGDALFDGINGRFNSMVNGFTNAIKRMITEAMAADILGALFNKRTGNMSSLFGSFGMSGNASAGGSGMGMLDIANMGSSFMNMVNGGFGFTSTLSGLGSMLPGSAGAFFSGMGGGTVVGVSSPAALAGSSFAGTAGAFGAGAAGIGLGTMLAGNKTLGPMEGWMSSASGAALGAAIGSIVPGLGTALGAFIGGVLGGAVNALFGRGPLKQKETELVGTIGAEGFESGAFTTGFKAKGGLFRSDKRDFARVDAITGEISTDNDKLNEYAESLARLSNKVIDEINETVIGVSDGLRQIGSDLGLGANALDEFQTQVHLVSESGKFLTEEQIAQEIARISDEMVRTLVPSIDELSRIGETSVQTIQRLGIEFNALENAASVLSGSTLAARDAVQALSFEQRSALIKSAGGLDVLNQGVSFFAQNFLSDQERLQLSMATLDEEMGKLGFSAEMSKDEFGDLIKSVTQTGGVSAETAGKLLLLAPLFLEVSNAVEQSTIMLQQASQRVRDFSVVDNALASLERSAQIERNRLTTEHNTLLEKQNTEIQLITESVGKLKALSDALKSTSSQISPMSIGSARSQLMEAIGQARIGRFPAADSLQGALQALASQTTAGFSTREDFMRSQAESVSLIDELGRLTGNQLTIEDRMLQIEKSAHDALVRGFNESIDRLDGILEAARAQVDALKGNSPLSLGDAQTAFNRATSFTPSAAPTDVTDDQIREFFSIARTPLEIAKAAIENQVSDERIMRVMKFSRSQVDQFFRENPDIPRFASGGFHSGGMRIVGERGPELEFTGPSRIVSNSDTKQIFDSEGIIAVVKEVVQAVLAGNKENRRTADAIDRVSLGGTSIRTTTA